MTPHTQHHKRAKRGSRRRAIGLVVGVAALAAEVLALRRRGYRAIGGRVTVRCSAGHEFTTWWIPGVSVRALRLAGWRLQRCPVGHHWAIVTPVRREDAVEGDGEPET